MKRQSYYLKHKTKAIISLIVLTLLVLLHHLLGRQRLDELQRSVSSIYKDRLMPATYIFEITDHMYQKKLLQEHSEEGIARKQEYTKHNQAIANLVKGYDGTYLTPEETLHWQRFKANLAQYNQYEANNISNALEGRQEQSFTLALNSLHQLATIQAGEGGKLNKDSLNILKGNDSIAQMELYILLGLGLCVVVLISLPEKVGIKDSTAFSAN